MTNPFDWRRFLSLTALAFVASLAIAVCHADIALLLHFLVAGPILLILTVVSIVYAAKGKSSRTPWFALGSAWVLVFFSFLYQHQIRSGVRWATWSGQYKNTLSRQSSSSRGLKHVEWDSWGFVGMDTTVYLVFDPSDSLWMSASSHHPREARVLPCAVAGVTRLERDWYAVTFYTDQNWDSCSQANVAR